MIFVEHLAGAGNVLVDAALLRPGNLNERIDIAANDRSFRARRRHRAKPLDFRERRFFGSLRHLGFLHLLFERGDFIVFGFTIRIEAKLLADGLHLLVEVVLALVLLHLPLDAHLNALLDLTALKLALERLNQNLEALARLRGAHKANAVFGRERHNRCSDVACLYRIPFCANGLQVLDRHLLHVLRIVFKRAHERAAVRFQVARFAGLCFQNGRASLVIARRAFKRLDAAAIRAVHKGLHRRVGAAADRSRPRRRLPRNRPAWAHRRICRAASRG